MHSANEIPQKNVSFSLFGINFTLKVHEDKIDDLLKAIDSLRQKSSRILRENPNLSPTQASVLVALESEGKLLKYLSQATPFERACQDRISRISHILKRNLNGK